MIRKWVPLWVVPVVMVLAVGTVWLRLTIVRTTYEINQTDKMIRNLQQEQEQSQLRVAGMKSPRTLETLARSKFGLSQPKSDQVIHVNSQ